MKVLIHQGGQVFLQLLPELADGTKIDFSGAAQEVVADPTVVTVTTNPNNPSQIAVAAVAANIGSTQVTITYTNADGTTAVLVLDVTVDPLDATVLDASQIGGEVPAGTAFPAPPGGTGATGSTGATGGTGATGAAAAPVVTTVAPPGGPLAGGMSVSITGTGFTGATAVAFGTTPAASFTVNSDTSITAVTPALPSAGAYDVLVTTPGGTNAAGSLFSAS